MAKPLKNLAAEIRQLHNPLHNPPEPPRRSPTKHDHSPERIVPRRNHADVNPR